MQHKTNFIKGIRIHYRRAFVLGVSAGILLLSIQMIIFPFDTAAYRQSSYYSQGSYYSQASYYSQSSYYSQASYYSQGSYYSEGSYYSQSYYQASYGPSYPVTYTFQYEPNGYCVNVSVSKTLAESGAVLTTVHADGFSKGCGSITSASRVLQRSVELRY